MRRRDVARTGAQAQEAPALAIFRQMHHFATFCIHDASSSARAKTANIQRVADPRKPNIYLITQKVRNYSRRSNKKRVRKKAS
jgi:hypothetical protein